MNVRFLQWIAPLATIAAVIGCQAPDLVPGPAEEARPAEAAPSPSGATETIPGVALRESPVPRDIVGRWKHPEKSVIVEISESDGAFHARVVQTPNGPPPREVRIFRNLRYDDTVKSFRGTLFVPERGRELDATWKVMDGRLMVTVSVGTFTRTIAWVRP
jgi:hypothetical protein